MTAVLTLQLDQFDAFEIAFSQHPDVHPLLELLVQVFQRYGTAITLYDDVVVPQRAYLNRVLPQHAVRFEAVDQIRYILVVLSF